MGPVTMSLISDYFPKDKRTKPFGIFLSGTHIGGAIALIVGGAVIEMVSTGKGVQLPFIGALKTWQIVFILVGLPGLFLLPLINTIKEPKRQGADSEFSFPEVFLFIRKRWQIYMTIFLGMACMGTVASAINAWVPAMFIRIHGWEIERVGLYFGLAILLGGVAGSILAGSMENFFSKRGYEDAKIRCVVFCGVLMCPVSIVGILSNNPYASLGAISFTVLLFGLPLVLGPASVMAVTPGRLRGQMGAIYIIFIGLFGGFIGPMLVPLLTDFVFNDDASLPYSLALVVGIVGPFGAAIMYMGRKYFVDVEKLIEVDCASQASDLNKDLQL